jgi:WD40 repeat protein
MRSEVPSLLLHLLTMMFFNLLLILCVQGSHGWTLSRASRRYISWERFSQDSNDNDDRLFFDDFAGQIIGGGEESMSLQSSDALQQRVQTIQQEQIQKDARILRNWKTGNWNVRGFSMETVDNSSQENSIIVSAITAASDQDSSCIWVGRTDGSVLKVQLGKEYWAYFRSEENGNSPAALLRDDALSQSAASDEEPFQIQQQFLIGTGPVTNILEHEEKYLFTVTESSNIEQWLLHEDPERSPVHCKTFQGAHSAGIVVMKVLPKTNMLFSAARDGSISFWNVETGDIVCNCVLDGGLTVHCADSDGHSIYLGTSEGTVIAYQVMDLLTMAATGGDSCPMPHGQWVACDNGALTSISCGGPGTLGRGREQSTFLLLTGDENGVIKQWEVIPRKVDGNPRLEQWPKLSTQRLAKKSHVFRGHHGAISSLRAIDATKFVSGGVDGTVRAWNPVSGKELFLMAGFDDPVKSLCLLEDLLVTDGMKKFVCVHDFGGNVEEESDDADFYLDNI